MRTSDCAQLMHIEKIKRLRILYSHLRVRGVSGLRVIDCSVMPTQVSAGVNGPAMALAWHAASLLIKDQR